MPTRFQCEFDDLGRIRIMNDREALAFLDEMAKSSVLRVVVGETITNRSLECGVKPPPPNGKDGCPNTMCPIEIEVRCSPEVEAERKRILDSRGSKD